MFLRVGKVEESLNLCVVRLSSPLKVQYVKSKIDYDSELFRFEFVSNYSEKLKTLIDYLFKQVSVKYNAKK